MPIEYSIDHQRRVVFARGVGSFSDADVFHYQREVWSRPEVSGYDELMDMTEVNQIPEAAPERLMELADLAVEMDRSKSRTKFAILAPHDLAFGLAGMFATFRGANEESTKEVAVFRTRAEALAFLGVAEDTSC